MIDSDIEQRLERMYAGYAKLPVDADVSWHRFARLRRRAAIQRRAIAAAAAVAVVTGATVATAFAYHGNGSEPSVSRHVNRPAPIGRLAITARIPQPGAGSAPGDAAIAGSIVSARGRLWGISYADYLFRIDQRANRVAFSEHVAGLSDLAAGGGSLWVLTSDGKSSGKLLEMDPVTASVIRTIPLSRACGQVLYSGGHLWVACGDIAVDFMRIDPATGRVLASTGTIYGVTDAAASPDGIWYVGHSGVAGFVGTGGRLRWIRVNDSAVPVSLVYTNSLVYADGALWAFTADETMSKIDPATGRIVKIYPSQTFDPSQSLGLNFLAIGPNSVWFLDDYGAGATAVLRVSMTSWRPAGRVTGVGSCGEPCWQLYYADGSVWVPTITHITRIDPVLSLRRHRRRGSR
jgi:hypothetical protein